MSVQHIQHTQNLLVVHDPIAQPAPSEYRFFLHGVEQVVCKQADEPTAVLFERTLKIITEARNSLMNNRSSSLNPLALVTCYAGELEPETLALVRKKHMTDFILEGLHAVAASKVPGDGTAKVKALRMLSEYHGVIAPKKTRVRATKEESAKPCATVRTGSE